MAIISRFNRTGVFDVSSSLDGSSVSPVSAEIRDLQGCGSPTHNAFGINGTFNYRVECGPPQVGYALSVKALTARESFLSQFNVNVPNTELSMAFMYAHALGWDVVATGSLPTAPNIGPKGTAAQGIKGGQFYTVDVYGSANVTTMVSIPRIKPRYDVCGNLDGFSASTAFSLMSADPETCEKVLVASGSVKAYWRTRGGFPLTPGVASEGHMAISNSRMATVLPDSQFDSIAGTSQALFIASNNVKTVYESPSRTNVVEIELIA